MGYLLILLIILLISVIGVGIWLGVSAIFASVLLGLSDKKIFILRTVLLFIAIPAFVWKILITVKGRPLVGMGDGTYMSVHIVLLIAIALVIVFSVCKRPKYFADFKSTLHVGMLVSSLIYLVATGMPHGWLTEGPRATWIDQPRITECGRFRYYMTVSRTWNENVLLTLTAADVATGRVNLIPLSTDDDFGYRYPRTPMLSPSSPNWADLEATDNPNVYILTTNSLSLFYRRLAFEVNIYSGSVTSVSPASREYLIYSEFETTRNGLFDFRLEWRQYLAEVRGERELRLRMVNLKTEENFVFTLLTGSNRAMDGSFLRRPTPESVRLLPTDISHIYTAILPERFAVFEIDLQENSSQLTPEYFAGAWFVTEDDVFWYRIYVSPITYERRSFTDIASDTFAVALQIININTGEENLVWLPHSIRQRVTMDDVMRFQLDWVTINFDENAGIYIAEITLPFTAQRGRVAARYTLRTSPHMHFGAPQ